MARYFRAVLDPSLYIYEKKRIIPIISSINSSYPIDVGSFTVKNCYLSLYTERELTTTIIGNHSQIVTDSVA